VGKRREASSARHVCAGVKPTFTSARAFRDRIADAFIPRGAEEQLKRYRRNHAPSARRDQVQSRVWSAMERFRVEINARYGILDDPPRTVPPPLATVDFISTNYSRDNACLGLRKAGTRTQRFLSA
jgi:hypothetical protein